MEIKLWEEQIPYALGEKEEDSPTLIPYLVSSEQQAPAMIICPGGGYVRRASHEGEPIALWLNSIGISAFVLNYRVYPYKHPAPLTDAKRAIRYVRTNARRWKIDETKVGILGFSAGGHVASTAGTLFDLGNKEAEEEIERQSSRPDLMVLCYPVITFGEFKHEGSRNHLIGEDAPRILERALSIETQVTKQTPPTFIWHTSDDASVPVENALLLATALSRNQVSFELHTFESGRHGLGLATEHPEAHTWTKLCQLWLTKHWNNNKS
ncbi:alpha/beta hydrolase [Halalkalibacter alkalisediminis]|uniref:Alpha/beta hydrolase n=1 Tax=Halalkalibacter alkalisediminis TaxID=935616 RepID=A0ABV6NC62_9BACI|nr:alpha/beta hydrolase [Halalkalibacter alkalisediminis]